MTKKIVIVGGVAGGATAAARLRRLDERSHIVLVERGEHISFANCGLPYYIGGTIKDRDKLLVQTVEGMAKRFKLDIRNLSEVTQINRDEKTVTIQNLTDGNMYTETYDELILSPGAKPIVPPFEGMAEANNIFTLRNIPDMDKIKQWIEERNPKNAIVIGGGFIGLEMAENLHAQGLSVTIVEKSNQVMAPLDPEMAAIVHEHIRTKASLILNNGIKHFSEKGRIITLENGEELTSDLIILAIGVRPENELAVQAGLQIGKRGGIIVNEYMQTDDPHIYAIGDAIEVVDFNHKTPTMVPLAWPANRQGRLVADVIYGHKKPYSGTLGTAIAKVFDLTVAVTGNNEKTLSLLDIPYQAVHLHPVSHAGYYPGGSPISMKMTFDSKTGVIYGVQGVGRAGVDKRIDVIATAIKGGLTVHDLPDLELAYAPPYSSAKDPVNMLGYVASHIVDGDLEVVSAFDVDSIVAEGGFLIDVRHPQEIKLGGIPGAVNIPLDELRDRLDTLPKDKPIYVTCQVGLRGYLATRILHENGFSSINISGGYKTYRFIKNDEIHIQDNSDKKSEVSIQSRVNPPAHDTFIDATGLACPGPIVKLHKAINDLSSDQTVNITVSDPGFTNDITAWCKNTGHELVSLHEQKDEQTFSAVIKKK
ncbi:CoA-disulfide reductase [Bacillus sp. A301a_S52]|nr:CoA-disulfide reductase [Bacillus sp. A301a_S52]